EELDAASVDRLKRRFYDCIGTLERREQAAALDPATCDLIGNIFRSAPSPTEVKQIDNYAQAFALRHAEPIGRLIERLGADLDLNATTHDIDTLLAGTRDWPARALHEVMVNYLGFPFWDVLTFPVMPWRESGEFNEIRVDRISAQDATGIA